ncbi:MAG: 50S ribosomal protein L3 [Candidatus Binatia bacterium]
MIQGLLGKKLGMTQVFSDEGNAIPVTVVEAGPCRVVQKKTKEKDGYEAVQLGFSSQKPKRMNKPLRGHFEKAEAGPTRILREVKTTDLDKVQVGQEIGSDIFSAGEFVDVIGHSKGRGFAGVMKRHGFSGAPGSHGTHESFRGPGSIGGSAFPSKVFRGKKLPGRMGAERVTAQNLQVIRVVPERNLLLIKGSVPGANGHFLLIQKSKKKPLK